MKKTFVLLLIALTFACGIAFAEDASSVANYGRSLLTALNARTQAPPSDMAMRTAPFSGTVKLTVKLGEQRIVTVEPTERRADWMWHQGINEIAWSTPLPQAPRDLAQRFHSIQFSVLVMLNDSHRYSFSEIKPLNGLAYVPFD